MASVFISYKQCDEDFKRVVTVREKLKALKIEVFRDLNDLKAHDNIHLILDKYLAEATAVLVLWTRSSITSKFVMAEAGRGLDDGKLVAAAFDQIKRLPLPFGIVVTPDLSDWIETGARADHLGWRSVLGGLEELVKRPLLALAEAIEDGGIEAKIKFVEAHPDDLASNGLAAEIMEARQRDYQTLLVAANELLIRTKLAGDRALGSIKSEFNRIKAEINKNERLIDLGPSFGLPDPQEEVVKAFRIDGPDPGRADLEKRAEQAEAAASAANAKLASIGVTVEALQKENIALKKAAVGQGALSWKRTAAMATALMIGAGLFAYWISHLGARSAHQVATEKTRESAALARQISDLLGENRSLSEKLSAAVAELTRTKGELELLKAGNLGGKLIDTQRKLDDASKKLEDANNKIAALENVNRDLNERLRAAQQEINEAGRRIASLERAKTDLDKTLIDTQKRFELMERVEKARAESENRCNELIANRWDLDLPPNAKSQTGTNPSSKEVIETCFTALPAPALETRRRILVQIGRGYVLQGNAPRFANAEVANASFATALSLFERAAEMGSGYAYNLHGWVLHGGLNDTNSKGVSYKLPGTDRARAWESFKKSAELKNPWGLVYAGWYLVWPQCSNNATSVDSAKGRRFWKEAQDAGLPAAYFAEGYTLWYGTKDIKKNADRARELLNRAASMDYAKAKEFLKTPPSTPEICVRGPF